MSQKISDFASACNEMKRTDDIRSHLRLSSVISNMGYTGTKSAGQIVDRLFPRFSHSGASKEWLFDLVLKMGSWFESGCPILRLSSSQAADICLTDISEELADSAMSPWETFCIKVDSGIFDIKCHNIKHIFVSQFDKRVFGEPIWSYTTRAGKFSISNSGNAVEMVSNSTIPTPGLSLVIGDEEDRAMKLLSTLAFGTCLAVSNEKTLSKEPLSKRQIKNSVHMLKYSLSREVTIDFSQHVRDYVSGVVSKHRTSRWIVRGHWRNQPYGPELSKKKILWIKPHWSGAVTGERAESKGYRIAL